jgi:hypothetical protein
MSFTASRYLAARLASRAASSRVATRPIGFAVGRVVLAGAGRGAMPWTDDHRVATWRLIG